jgi:phage/plasmid-like protein (TIGR03299 family)
VPAWIERKLAAGDVVPEGAMILNGNVVEEIAAVDPETNETIVLERRAVHAQTVFVQSERTKLITRDDTNAELGRVGLTYEVMFIRWMGEILEACAAAGAKYETAGSVNGGAQVYALLRLDEPVQIAGDDTQTYPYIVLLNSFDGSGAVKVLYTCIRVVCWNTYSMASFEGDRTGHQFIFRHVGDMRSKIEEAKQAIVGMRETFAQWVQLAETLAQTPVDETQVKDFTTLFLPEPISDVATTDRVKQNVATARATFSKLYHESVTTDGHRGTALGLLDASVEYLDHVRRAMSKDTLMNRTLLKPEPMKRAALQRICAVTDLKLEGVWN